jgi:hypothetical protein
MMDAAPLVEAMQGFRELIRDPVVAQRWEAPSALRHYTIGGVVGHVCLATAWTQTVANAPEPVGRPVLSLGEWFGHVRGGDASGEGAVHAQVRRQADSLAARGAAAVAESFDRVTARVVDIVLAVAPERLVSLAPVRPDAVLTFRDFLSTRLVELVVHSDDVAVSVGKADHVLPSAALRETLAVLLDIARMQHGDLGVLRTLTRLERASPHVFPVL